MSRTFPKLTGPIVYRGLTLGEGSYINADSIIIPSDGFIITIGENCSIGHWCYLSCRMHKTENQKEWFSGNITIEDNVWIGNCAVIYPNVTIGKNSIVGHAVTVVHDIPPDCIIKNTSVTVRKT